MAFGQQSGPPASHRQVQRLLDLLVDAGHADFRDARGPMGFTQRQAGGKFTVAEAEELIERLEQEQFVRGESRVDPADAPAPAPPRSVASAARSSRAVGLERFDDHQLAAELQRRGWVVMAP